LVQHDKLLTRKAPIDWRLFVVLASFLTGGCSGAGNSQSEHQSNIGSSSGGGGILASMRPKANPELIEKIRAQERAQGSIPAANAQGQSQGQPNQWVGLNGLASRVLPKVSTDPIAPPAEEAQSGALVSPVDTSQQQAGAPMSVNTPIPQAAATYGTPYNAVPAPPPGALGGALVPPPPAVTLTTQAQAVSAMPDPNNPYMNPYGYPAYMNPYGMAYPPQQQQPATPQPRPSGLFGNGGGGRSASSDDDDSSSRSKRGGENFVPITPTGMEARSAYKQRDDLKVLWKGLLSSNNLTGMEPKVLEQLGKLEVGLPSESTKGNFSINQRQVDSVFKPSVPGIDRRVVPQVRKSQADLVQAYSRYLYTYNKFALAQQTVTARKQEVEVASSNAEQQRAAADLAQAQTELDSTKDDMRSAQIELAQASSPAAARAVIGKVSGVAPGLETLAAADQGSGGESHKGKIGGFVGMFSFGHGKAEEKQAHKGGNTADGDNDAADNKKIASADKDKKAGKESKKKEKHAEKSNDKVKVTEGEKAQDLSPAPTDAETEAKASKADAPAGSGPSSVAFTLKGVNVTARKSILTVAIKNTGAEAFTFNPDVISVADGNHKLPDAAMRADFDSTLVQPNQEVKGTITIFGRPWNDRLSVSLSDSGHAIQMRR
jgi:hypothetical protein